VADPKESEPLTEKGTVNTAKKPHDLPEKLLSEDA
jgi:hypothetical protein